MPPTAPTAIAPVFDLRLEDDVGVVVTVDGLALVEVETRGAVPVTSGKSVAVLRMHGACNSWTNYALPPAAVCAVERFQLLPGYVNDYYNLARTLRGTYDRINIRPAWYPCTGWDGFREPDEELNFELTG